MLQKLLQIAGVSTKEEFYKKYPTEESFFKAHPEAKQLLGKKSQQSPMMAPQAMYGGGYMPQAKYGVQTLGDPEPLNSDYPTYEAYKAAHDQWLASQQEQANNPMPPEEMQQSTSVDANGYPVSVNPNAQAALPPAAPAAPATSFKLNDYQGGSVYEFLSTQGKAGDFKSRKKLAQSLGMSNYKGTATQNGEMMEMIRQNPDILSSYDDATAPQTAVTRKAAQTQNKKAAPTTEQLSNSKSVAATGKPKGTGHYGKIYENPGYKNGVPITDGPGSIPFGSGSFLEQIPINQPQPWGGAKPRFQGKLSESWDPEGKTNKKFYADAFETFKRQSEQGKKVGVPYSLNSNVAKIYEMALKDWKEQTGMAMGGQPCYNCGGMYDQGGMYDDGRAVVNRGGYEGRALVNNYSHGGYYGNVPQHGNPGTYADGTSGTFNGGQGFAFGGFLGDVSQGMRDGSLTALAGSILPMANIYQDKLTGSPITGEMTKLGPDGKPLANSNLKNDLTKYLSNLTGDIKKEDLQSIVGKYALGGMASQGYVPEYGSQSYGGFAYGGIPLPQYNMGSNYYPEGGEVSPEDQAAMEMQQAQQSAPPQEGGAPEQGGGQMDPQQIIQAVGEMLQQGMQPQEIIQQLSQMGIPPDQAQQLVEAVMQQMQGGGEEEAMQEQMMQEGQGAPMQEGMQEGMEQMMPPPMGRYGGSYAYGGNYGVGNLSKFVGRSSEPNLDSIHQATMQNMRSYANGGMMGEEMDVTPEQMEYLRKQGYKFDII